MENSTLGTAIEILLRVGWAVAGFFDSSELISYINIACLLCILLCVWRWTKRNGSKNSFLQFAFPRAVWKNSSARLDIKFYFLIQPLALFIIAPFLLALMQAISYDIHHFLTQLFGASHGIISGAQDKNTFWAVVLYSLLVFLAKDFAFFISHYFQHKWQWLWCFHKVHHSPTVLTPFTAMRFHPVDMAWNMAWGIALAALVSGVCQYVFYNGENELELFGNNVLIALSYLTTHNLRHSHIWLHYPHWLSSWLISPAMHQIHHSAELRHHDKNMGYLFAGWDRLFGTSYNPKSKEEFSLGVYTSNHTLYTGHYSIAAILWKPFEELWQLAKKRDDKHGAVR